MTEEFDAIVIGAGQAGPALAGKLAADGQRVALMERRQLGGSCINFGCTPTKAMVASARAAWAARHGGDFGVRVQGPVEVDMKAVQARAAGIVEQSRRGMTEWLEGAEDITLVRGHARFTGPRTVQVEGVDYRAGRVFIDTGSRPVVPDLPGLEQVGYLTSTDMAGLDRLPEHLVVLGGGAIGVEFAQMFRRFGSRVTLVERHGRLLDHEDTDVSEAIQALLESEGVEVRVSTQATGIEAAQGGFVLGVDGPEGAGAELRGSDLLLALGRRPNSDDLGLEEAGIDTDEAGHIRVDGSLHTSAEGVWALGDVAGTGAFTHTAYDDQAIVADALFGEGRRSLEDRIPAYAVYTDPPFAHVGLNENRLRGSGRPVHMAWMPMGDVARARERGETHGFIKVLVDPETERFLGASIVGIAGDEVVHGILNLMRADAPYTVLKETMGIHPTVSELLPSLLERLEPLPARPGQSDAA